MSQATKIPAPSVRGPAKALLVIDVQQGLFDKATPIHLNPSAFRFHPSAFGFHPSAFRIPHSKTTPPINTKVSIQPHRGGGTVCVP